jgi:hypothetical protein
MFSLSALVAIAAVVTAAGVGVVVGRRRPVRGALAAAGVLLAAVAGYCALVALAWPM